MPFNRWKILLWDYSSRRTTKILFLYMWCVGALFFSSFLPHRRNGNTHIFHLFVTFILPSLVLLCTYIQTYTGNIHYMFKYIYNGCSNKKMSLGKVNFCGSVIIQNNEIQVHWDLFRRPQSVSNNTAYNTNIFSNNSSSLPFSSRSVDWVSVWAVSECWWVLCEPPAALGGIPLQLNTNQMTTTPTNSTDCDTDQPNQSLSNINQLVLFSLL